MSDTWTPEEMRERADHIDTGRRAGRIVPSSITDAAMLRQGAADREDNARLRERVTALEADLATVDALRQAAEAARVELAGRVTGLEANWQTLKAWVQTQDAATVHVDDAVNWAYERMRAQMALLEELASRQAAE